MFARQCRSARAGTDPGLRFASSGLRRYTLLGLFDASNLATSAGLAPLGLVGIFCGVWLRKRTPEVLFYRLCYAFLFVAGLKLLYDGVSKLI